MDFTKKEKGESLWQQMLESMLTQKTEKVGNLLWCGSSKVGKKKLISEIQDIAKHHKQKNYDETFKSLETIYVMDFKYVKINRNVNEYTEEQSKLNFYILNKQYEYMKEFLTTDMLNNLIVTVIVDLEEPESLESSLEEWIYFLKSCIADYISELSEEKKHTILKNLRDTKAKIRSLSTFSTLDGFQYDTNTDSVPNHPEILENEHNEEDIDLEIPLLIIGNKTDVLDKSNDEKLFDYIQYVLRQAAVKYDAMVMTTSSIADRNLQLLYKVLGRVLVGLKIDDPSVFEPSYNLLKMFVPMGIDDIPLLNSQIPNANNYVFKDAVVAKEEDVKKPEKSDIKDIAEFLNELNNGQFVYQNNTGGETSRDDFTRLSMTKNSSRLIDSSSVGLTRSNRFLEENQPSKNSNLDKVKSILRKP